MARLKDQAICIRHLDWSETSQIVVLLTRDEGKLRGLAKGSRRQSPSAIGRFSGGIELLTRGEVLATIKPAADLAAITEWDLQEDYHHLRTSLRAQHLGMYAADLCNALFAEHDAHPRTFDALARFLESLTNVARAPGELLRFQWELLDDAGYRPEISRDAATGEALPDLATYTFDPQAGGLTQQGRAQEWRVRAETVAVLRAAAKGEEPGTPGFAGGAVSRANRLLCVYVRAILDEELPTMRVVLGQGD